ncbi:MAG: hypothetical protein ABIF85_00485 [Nanoarchaeota archaeon]|nr:hypothetical protein [Nanoarchaeota archaeon]MBU4452479.1 hypothetical protein [Nanoarchaeota archaeon]MCG2723444.1 hypothetical protein [archaeon]
MALRGILRDIISIYIGYQILKIWIFGSAFSSNIGWAAVALLLLTIWFVFEKLGIM